MEDENAFGLIYGNTMASDAELKNEISNLCEQTRVAKQNGFSSIMVGQHFLSELSLIHI